MKHVFVAGLVTGDLIFFLCFLFPQNESLLGVPYFWGIRKSRRVQDLASRRGGR